MALSSVFQRPRLGRFILFLVFLVIVLQVFHMTLLTRLEAKEAMEKFKLPGGRHIVGNHLTDLVASVEEKVHNSHRLDHSGTYHIIANILSGEGETSSPDKKDHAEDVAIVTQCSSNHLHHVPHLVEAWNGPISVSVFTFDKDMENALQRIIILYTCNEKLRKYVSFHLVYPLNRAPTSLIYSWKNEVSCDRSLSDEKTPSANYAIEGIEYPHNLLRNLAIKYSLTRYVFMIDIDMIPSANIRNDFLKQMKFQGNSILWKNTAFIVPAFELKEGIKVPNGKSALLEMWKNRLARPFYSKVCPVCQQYTDYEKWRGIEQGAELGVAYTVEWKDPFEPFFISSKWMPPYDERFKQYGFNRISQVCELHVSGVEFAVLNRAFLLHRGFKEKGDFHSTKEQEMERNVKLFRLFKNELKVKYPNSTRRCY